MGCRYRVSPIVSVCLTLVSSPVAARDARLEAAADAYLRPLVDLQVFQGAVLVSRGETVLLEKGYGLANVELGVTNTPERVFRIASLSKPFTEVALGKLADEGKLDLDAPLSRFLPDYPQADRITIRMLMAHRAGVPNRNSIPYDEEAHQPNTLDSLVRVLAKTPLQFEPGGQRHYTNGGYALLAYVIQKVTGMPYADYLQQQVFAPLGLTHTRHEGDLMLVPNRAYGYLPSALRRGELVPAPFQQMETKTGGGSLVSTVGDLHRFLRAMYRDDVVTVARWRELFPLADSTFALQGRCPGFNVYMMRDFGHDLDLVVLCNNYAGGTLASIAQDLAALALGSKPQVTLWRADLPSDSTRSQHCVGRYRPPPGALPYGDSPFDLRWQAGDLVLYRDRVAQDVLLPQADGTFLLRNMCSELRFVGGSETAAGQASVRLLWLDKTVPLERLPDEPGSR